MLAFTLSSVIPPVFSSGRRSVICGLLAAGLVASALGGCGASTGMSASGGNADRMDNGGGGLPSQPECEGYGTWYLRTGDVREVLQFFRTPGSSGCIGMIGDESTGPYDSVDFVHTMSTGAALFRRVGEQVTTWYRVRMNDGLMTGRVAIGDGTDQAPDEPTLWDTHVTGWRAETFDAELAPRVWDLLVDSNVRARLRLDRSMTSPSGFEVRYKTYGSIYRNIGESDSFDGVVDEWDGKSLRFRIMVGDNAEVWRAEVSGRSITGEWRWDGANDAIGMFMGTRAEVLSHGFAPMGPEDRDSWQQHTRRRLLSLLMAGNPAPLSTKVTVLQKGVAPFVGTDTLPDRDDGRLDALPQAYHLDELQIDLTLPDPDGGDPIARRIHGWMAKPDEEPPAGGWPVAGALNGHEGSARQVMTPDNELFWYGDSFARRGYVVISVDISHRPYSDRGGLYPGLTDGDDPANGNGPHPAIRASGLDSDWEEDGERAWDVMRAIDYVAALPYVNPSRMIVTGLSMGGEITTWTAAFDSRLAMAIPSGYSPDLSVLLLHGSHGCWQWNHADIREYIDTADLQALIAPRPILVETGKMDWSFSWLPVPFAGDKQVMRATRSAYVDAPERVIHYLHYDRHHYHVGNPVGPTEPEVQVPVFFEPPAPDSLDWQRDGETMGLGEDLFGTIARLVP